MYAPSGDRTRCDNDSNTTTRERLEENSTNNGKEGNRRETNIEGAGREAHCWDAIDREAVGIFAYHCNICPVVVRRTAKRLLYPATGKRQRLDPKIENRRPLKKNERVVEINRTQTTSGETR